MRLIPLFLTAIFATLAIADAGFSPFTSPFECLAASSLTKSEVRRLHVLAFEHSGANPSLNTSVNVEFALKTYNQIFLSICSHDPAVIDEQSSDEGDADEEYLPNWNLEISDVLYDLSVFLLSNQNLFLSYRELKWPEFMLKNYPSVSDYVNGALELQQEEYFTTAGAVIESCQQQEHRSSQFAHINRLVPLISWNLLGFSVELGNPNAQHALAVAYSTGIFAGYLVPMDAARALFLEQSAALSGHILANMGMGYRFANGVTVVENCERALIHYEIAANHATELLAGRKHTLYIEKSKLSDIDSDINADMTSEVIDYYTQQASDGDVASALQLYSLYKKGIKSVAPDEALATHYLKLASEYGSPQASGILGYEALQKEGDSITPARLKKIKSLLQYALNRGEPSGHIGMAYIYMFGIGGEQVDIEKAKSILLRNIAKHPDAGFYLGELIMNNLWKQPTKKPPTGEEDLTTEALTSAMIDSELAEQADPVVATAILRNLEQGMLDEFGSTVANTASTKAALATASSLLAATISSSTGSADGPAGTPSDAVNYYLQASQKGHPIAQHRVSHLLAYGIGATRSCLSAVAGFKVLSERGDWMVGLTSGHKAFEAHAYKEALSHFAALATVGVESAQFNAAHILTRKHCPSPLFSTDYDSIVPSERETALHIPNDEWYFSFVVNGTDISNVADSSGCELRAMYLYGLSAAQGAPDSYVRMGDIHYYGSRSLYNDKREAARYYQVAADMHHTHALFNLGVMHQAGDGVLQDFHLAKRYYDQASEFDMEAKLPRTVAIALMEGQRSLVKLLGPSTANQCWSVVSSFLRSFVESLSEIRLRRTAYYDQFPLNNEEEEEEGQDYGEETEGEGSADRKGQQIASMSSSFSSSISLVVGLKQVITYLMSFFFRFHSDHYIDNSNDNSGSSASVGEVQFGFGLGPTYSDFMISDVEETPNMFTYENTYEKLEKELQLKLLDDADTTTTTTTTTTTASDDHKESTKKTTSSNEDDINEDSDSKKQDSAIGYFTQVREYFVRNTRDLFEDLPELNIFSKGYNIPSTNSNHNSNNMRKPFMHRLVAFVLKTHINYCICSLIVIYHIIRVFHLLFRQVFGVRVRRRR